MHLAAADHHSLFGAAEAGQGEKRSRGTEPEREEREKCGRYGRWIPAHQPFDETADRWRIGFFGSRG